MNQTLTSNVSPTKKPILNQLVPETATKRESRSASKSKSKTPISKQPNGLLQVPTNQLSLA